MSIAPTYGFSKSLPDYKPKSILPNSSSYVSLSPAVNSAKTAMVLFVKDDLFGNENRQPKRILALTFGSISSMSTSVLVSSPRQASTYGTYPVMLVRQVVKAYYPSRKISPLY